MSALCARGRSGVSGCSRVLSARLSTPPHQQQSGTDDGTAPAEGSAPEKVDNKAQLWSRYREMKKLVYDLLPPGVCNLLNPATICSNNEISLGDIEIYGFDYDYTLAQYSDMLHKKIFTTARDILIQHYKGMSYFPMLHGLHVKVFSCSHNVYTALTYLPMCI